MASLKIGIVEDDLMIAESIIEMLLESGYQVTKPAKRYSEAIAIIEEEQPDLLLLDVMILGKMDGIDVARTVQKSFGIPFIFLTANADFETIQRAKEVTPAAFLAKPVTSAQLYAAIEIAMSNVLQHTSHINPSKKEGPPFSPSRTLFVKDGYHYSKVSEEDIVYAASEQNYMVLHLRDGSRVTMRATMSGFMEVVSPTDFLQVHRAYIVARAQITGVEGNTIIAGRFTVPIGKNYRDEILRSLGARK